LRACETLRHELNQLGGANIAIDHQLFPTNALLKDEQARDELIDGLDSLPIDNVWLRTSGFGATATGVGTRHFIEAVRRMHHIGLPLVADGVGVPEARRAEHFLLRHVDPAVRSARLGAHLRIADERVRKAVNNVKSRLVRLRDALADLQAKEGTPTRSRSPAFRGGAKSISAAMGR